MTVARQTYRPVWAKHVLGQYTPRKMPLEGEPPEPQIVECKCEWPGCGAYFRIPCLTGAVHSHIHNFAQAHFHNDPFGAPPTSPKKDG